MAYFDAAYIAKFYLDESESEAVRVFVEEDGHPACCVFGRLEVVSVFHRKFREIAIVRAAFFALLDQFEADCAANLWQWLPITTAVQEAAATRYRALPRNAFLRAADMLHLACASENGFAEVYSNDRHLLAAARHFELKGITIR